MDCMFQDMLDKEYRSWMLWSSFRSSIGGTATADLAYAVLNSATPKHNPNAGRAGAGGVRAGRERRPRVRSERGHVVVPAEGGGSTRRASMERAHALLLWAGQEG